MAYAELVHAFGCAPYSDADVDSCHAGCRSLFSALILYGLGLCRAAQPLVGGNPGCG